MTKKEEGAAENQKPAKLSKPLQDIINKIEKLTVLELSELVSALEDKFGVSAQAPAVTALPNVAGTGASQASPAEEKTEFNVVLTAAGDKKIDIIKAIRQIKPDLGLKDAKDLVESTPQTILEAVKKEEAKEAQETLEGAGGTVELK